MKSFSCLLILIIFSAQIGFAQVEPKVSKMVEQQVSPSDTLALVMLKPVNIFTKRTFESRYEEAVFNKLKNNVLTVYPYAKIAGELYQNIQEDSEALKKRRQKKKMLRSTEDSLRVVFEEKLKNLNVTQGDILIKLINRETGNNCFQLIKELKNPISAVVYQNVGRFYGYNLREPYDPEAWPDLEYIVRMLESGDF